MMTLLAVKGVVVVVVVMLVETIANARQRIKLIRKSGWTRSLGPSMR